MSSSATKKIWIQGLSGKMGLEIQSLVAKTSQWHILGGSGKGELIDRENGRLEPNWNHLAEHLMRTDLLIDFSNAAANLELFKIIEVSSLREKAILIGTTGLSDSLRTAWSQLTKDRQLRLLQAPNTSLGVILALKISQQVAQVLAPLNFDIEILEAHHRTKIDSPSGTAKYLADGLANSVAKTPIISRTGQRQNHEIGIASLRGGSVFGEHEIRFLGDDEELVIQHRALSRKLFAQGTLILADWLLNQPPGAWTLNDMTIDDIVKLVNGQKRDQIEI